MFWHVDTEAVCLIIFLVFYLYTRKYLDWGEASGKAFRLFSQVAIVVVAIDIVASLAMDFSDNWWFYQVINCIYFVSVPVLAVLWLLYTYIQVQGDQTQRRVKQYVLFSLPYLLLTAGILSNPWTGWMFGLTKDMVYSRGPLFVPATFMQYFYCVLTVLMVLIKWKGLDKTIRTVLITAPIIGSVATTIQLANTQNGYLLMNSGYLIAYILVYLNVQGKQEEMRRLDRERDQEFHRFISYIYRANEAVFEIDLIHHKRIDYAIDATGHVEEVVSPCNWDEVSKATFMSEDIGATDKPLSTEALKQLICSGGEAFLELRTRRENGDCPWYAYTVIGLQPDRRHPMNAIFFKKNIDDQKQEEQKRQDALKDALNAAEQASAAKGSFMSRMSHEIRTPLNAVIGYLDIAKDDRGDADKVAHCLEQSALAARHLLQIINDVLDISSIESGRMKIANDDFDLSQLVHALTTIFYAQAHQKQVHFDVNVTGLTEEWVRGDSLRVNQILMNLLSNAIKFTPEGGTVTLDVEQKGIHDGKVHMQFRVTDTGIGMSEEFLSRMFRPFEQEDATTARNYGGTGLGLSISNNLVKMMGGTIMAESKQGVGTSFTVTLAFGKLDDNLRDHAATDSFANLRALVVDDEESACDHIRVLLEHCGVKCDTVNSGKKALRRITTHLESNHPYDLCIVDWSMPEMNGLETARQIRALSGDKVPIIIATSYDYSAIIDEARQAGVNKIIAKPLFQSTLFDMLVNTYGKYAPGAQKAAVKHQVNFHGMHVLLAEDNEMNMEIALDILTKAGMKVTPAANGKEALEAFTGSDPGTFDAILMDVQMPVMDGYAATRAIRKSDHPQAKQIPIIAMTANAFTSDVTEALAAGMNDHISKPVSYEHLFDALNRLTGEEKTEA